MWSLIEPPSVDWLPVPDWARLPVEPQKTAEDRLRVDLMLGDEAMVEEVVQLAATGASRAAQRVTGITPRGGSEEERVTLDEARVARAVRRAERRR